MMNTYPASMDNLGEMLQFITDEARDAGFPDHDIAKIESASEEALVNVISYAYPQTSGTVDIVCDSSGSLGLKVIIKDRGIPYNPLVEAKNKDLTSPLENRTLGGYGVMFILEMMDEVDYKRENDTNILTLTKYIAQKT